MKKTYRTIIGIIFICLMTFIGIKFITKVKEKNKIERKLATIPDFSFLKLDGSDYANINLSKEEPIVFIYLNSECEFCQEEAKSIYENLDKFKNVQVVFVSKESIETIKKFSQHYNLNNQSNITFLYDKDGEFSNRFDATTIPYILIYNKNHQLIKKNKGQLNAEGILRVINQND